MATWTAYKTSKVPNFGAWAFDGIGHEGNPATFDSVNSTSSHYIFNNADGTKTILNGSGFAGGGDVSWTSLTSVQHLASDNSVIEQITNITAPSAAAGHFFSGILAGDDTFIGSSGADQFYGHGGADTILPGGGADNINASRAATVRLGPGDFTAGEGISAGTLQFENAGNVDLRVGIVDVTQLHFFSGTTVVTLAATALNGGSNNPGIPTITGSAGVDGLIVTGVAGADYSGLTFNNWTVGQDTITYLVGTGNFGTIKTTAQNETFQLTGDGGGIQSGGGDDTFVFTGSAFHGGIGLDGGTGTNVIQLNSATVDYSSDVTGSQLTNIQQIQYVSGNSTFTVTGANLPTGPHTIVGSAGIDTFVVKGTPYSHAADLSGFTFNSWTDGTDKIIIDGRFGDYLGPADITGSSHADIIYGYNAYNYSGHVSLNGGGGNDIFYLGTGTETLTGGSGSDRFVFNAQTGGYTVAAIVTDFTVSGANHDLMDFRALTTFHSLSDVLAVSTQNGADTVIDIGNGGSITLQNVTKESLTAADFVGQFQSFSSSGAAFDVDGDGKKDWVQIDNGNVDVWHSNGTSFDPLTTWATGATPSDRLADLNGDGKADLVQYFIGADRAGYVYGALSNGNGFNAWTPWERGATASDRLADMNGDGKADLVQYFLGADHAGHIEVALSNGTSFGSYGDWQTGAGPTDRLVDMNGDGKSDLVQLFQGREYISLSTGSGFGSWSPWLTVGGTNQDILADVEGLGRPDLIQFYQGRVLVAHNTGTGFGAWNDWLNSGSPASSTDRFADMTGDGKADLVHIDAAGNVSVAVSNGTGLGAFTSWGSGATTNDKLIDLNGDGKRDLLQVSPGGTAYVALSTGSGLSPWSVWATGPNGGNAGAAGVADTSASTAPGSGVASMSNTTPIPDISLLNNYMASSFVTDGGTGSSNGISPSPSTDPSALFANPVQMQA